MKLKQLKLIVEIDAPEDATHFWSLRKEDFVFYKFVDGILYYYVNDIWHRSMVVLSTSLTRIEDGPFLKEQEAPQNENA